MWLVLSNHKKIDKMSDNEPKTRKEKKGGRTKTNVYNQKTVRLKAAVLEQGASKRMAEMQTQTQKKR